MILMIWKTSITLNEEIMLATGFRQQEMFPQLLVQNMKETVHPHAQTYSKYCIKETDSGDGEGPMCCRFKCSPMLWKTKKRVSSSL